MVDNDRWGSRGLMHAEHMLVTCWYDFFGVGLSMGTFPSALLLSPFFLASCRCLDTISAY